MTLHSQHASRLNGVDVGKASESVPLYRVFAVRAKGADEGLACWCSY